MMVPPRCRSRSISQISPHPVRVANENRLPANSVWCGFWFPRFRHGGYKFLPGVLLNAYAHFFTQRDMLIPRLLELRAPVATVQNIVQRRDRFNHQKMTDRRGGRGSDLPWFTKPSLAKNSTASSRALQVTRFTFLTRYRLQGHRHQRPQPFILHRGMNGHKANGGFIFRIDML